MSYRVTNRTSRTVLLRLRSGQTLHLAAGARTDELDGAEINGNRRIASLVDRHLVTLEKSAASTAPAKKTSKRSRTSPDKASSSEETSAEVSPT